MGLFNLLLLPTITLILSLRQCHYFISIRETRIFESRCRERHQTCQTIHSRVSYAQAIIIDIGSRSRELHSQQDVRRDVSHSSWSSRVFCSRITVRETDAVLGREFYDSCAVITVLFKSPSQPRRYHDPHWS